VTSANQKQFLVLYLAPASVMQAWAATDPEERKVAEEKMRGEWGRWMAAHAAMVLKTDAGGKTKRVTQTGVSDARNEIILCSVVAAESHEAAAQAFVNHPHLQIPQSSIEIMELRPVGAL
jgi:hypothetical protein